MSPTHLHLYGHTQFKHVIPRMHPNHSNTVEFLWIKNILLLNELKSYKMDIDRPLGMLCHPHICIYVATCNSNERTFLCW